MTNEDEVIKKIKDIKIQGANNIARGGIKIYSKHPTKRLKKKLINARPTEPLLFNSIKKFDKGLNYSDILKHFDLVQERVNKFVLRLLKGKKIVYTHCHSSTVINALIYAHKHKWKGEVYNTETRPLFQGRKTARDLKKAGIKVTMFVDAAIKEAAEGSDIVFLGADAILKDGVVNKIGSNLIGEIIKNNKIPLYILSDSWKYSKKTIKIEERKSKEVWKNKPKGLKIENPAFEKIEKRYIKGIVSELGILTFDKFLKKVK